MIPGIDLLEPNLYPTQRRPGVPASQASSSSANCQDAVWAAHVLSCLQGASPSVGSLVLRFSASGLVFLFLLSAPYPLLLIHWQLLQWKT